MGGVINIVTRKQQEEGVKNNMQVGYGSYNTLQTEFSNRVKKGCFSSVVTGHVFLSGPAAFAFEGEIRP